MTLDEYIARPPALSRWRAEAWRAIVDVVNAVRSAPTTLLSPTFLWNTDDVLARVDGAYPFGERTGHPYKMWLVERRRFMAAIDERAMPTSDEIAACEVARDAILDEVGDDIVQRLLAQAPNRHARKCAVCGAKPGRPCTELVPADPPAIREGNPYDNVNRALASQSHQRLPLVVPHQARLVGHGDSGPLFGGQP